MKQGLLLIMTLLMSSCVSIPFVEITESENQKLKTQIVATIETQPFTEPDAACTDQFVPHDLDHITTIRDDVPRLFESNGAGLGINDLDNDGDLDFVLANLAGPNSIFWNDGDLIFRKEVLSHGTSRAVNIVDVNGDGWLDILFSRHLQLRPTLWVNQGQADNPSFEQADWFTVANPYTMSWADLDQDGDLDFVAATYDAELEKAGQQGQPLGARGVIYYENQDLSFEPTFLSPSAQTLAILLNDLNGDNQPDIMVGNDFFQPDLIWYRQNDGWQAATPFETTARNTMSFDIGDLDNDGHHEIFSADMKPYANDAKTQLAWNPLMEKMQEDPIKGDAQIMENVLQIRSTDGTFHNMAPAVGVTATGWSWSAKFGDLNNDGLLDLYVVNGMMAEEMFGHLPNFELIEENQVFAHDGQGKLQPKPEWGLNSQRSGRSMSMADLDDDGDLDILINNLLSPAMIFENRLCDGSSLTIDLVWPESQNTRAIGAVLRLYSSTGVYQRQVQVASGYLSGDPTRVHFGFPVNSELSYLEIQWPDGQISHITALTPQTRLTIRRKP